MECRYCERFLCPAVFADVECPVYRADHEAYMQDMVEMEHEIHMEDLARMRDGHTGDEEVV